MVRFTVSVFSLIGGEKDLLFLPENSQTTLPLPPSPSFTQEIVSQRKNNIKREGILPIRNFLPAAGFSNLIICFKMNHCDIEITKCDIFASMSSPTP